MLLASPITLIALLTTVAHTWRQEALTENYREVARLGKEFYERLATFADHFDDVRKKLDGAVQAYNKAAGSFETPRARQRAPAAGPGRHDGRRSCRRPSRSTRCRAC